MYIMNDDEKNKNYLEYTKDMLVSTAGIKFVD